MAWDWGNLQQLVIAEVRPEHAGTYKCSVIHDNEMLSDSTNVWLASEFRVYSYTTHTVLDCNGMFENCPDIIFVINFDLENVHTVCIRIDFVWNWANLSGDNYCELCASILYSSYIYVRTCMQ